MRALRLTGTLLIAAGTLTLTWALLVWQWQDPFTAAYTHFEQGRLADAYAVQAGAFRPPPVRTRTRVELRREVAAAARRYRASLHTGGPVGRLQIGSLGVDMIVVEGTDHESLKKGPGHYAGSHLPGQGELVYVAGHRTTYLAPFSHIDDIDRGAWITFELPYGTFSYRVGGHRVVPAQDVGVLRSRHRDELVLQACQPRFFASHRYLVYARLVSFTPPGGQAVPAGPSRLAAASYGNSR
jgi:sortase A